MRYLTRASEDPGLIDFDLDPVRGPRFTVRALLALVLAFCGCSSGNGPSSPSVPSAIPMTPESQSACKDAASALDIGDVDVLFVDIDVMASPSGPTGVLCHLDPIEGGLVNVFIPKDGAPEVVWSGG